jgi:DNA-binding CsgD family transcriptional regulator
MDSLKDQLQQKISLVSQLAEFLPIVIVLHDLPDRRVRYLSKTGLELLGRSWEEISAMSPVEFQDTFFTEEGVKEATPKIASLLEENGDNFVSYFQQVKTSKKRTWDWYMSMSKVFARDEENKPTMVITLAMQIDPEHYFTAKATRILEENNFIKKHHQEFATLTKREKEILALLATGKSASEIADLLHISEATAETHRKNIKRKTGSSTHFDLSRYARAFDLI